MIGMANTLLTSGLIFSLVLSNWPTRFFISDEKPLGRGLNAPLTIFIAKK